MTRLAVLFLGSALVLSVVSIATLAGFGRTIPDVLANLALADLTGLAALLRPGDPLTPPESPQGSPEG